MTNTSPPQTPEGLHFHTQEGGLLALHHPFRGTLVVAPAGSGKTAAVAVPMLEQFAQKNFAGLVYEYDSVNLANAAKQAVAKAAALAAPLPAVRLRSLSFHVIHGLGQSDKVNPLHPDNIPTVAAAMECAAALIKASPKYADNFYTTSAQTYLTGIIWFYRNNYPALCTIPHVVATVQHDDFKRVLHMLSTDPDCQELVQSLIRAVKQGAEKQFAGVVASLRVDMSVLATSKNNWVLNPSEAKGEGFSLNLNDPSNPTLLTINSDPTLAASASPVISCIIAVALRLMNQPRKQPSYVLLDGTETLYIPGLDSLTATARSNKVAVVCLTREMAELNEAYGKDKAQVLVSNLNNQFYGKPASAESSELVSRLFKDNYVYAQPAPNFLKRFFLAMSGKDAQPKFSSAAGLQHGEFMGAIAGNPPAIFKAALRLGGVAAETPSVHDPLPEALAANNQLIRTQVDDHLRQYPELVG